MNEISFYKLLQQKHMSVYDIVFNSYQVTNSNALKIYICFSAKKISIIIHDAYLFLDATQSLVAYGMDHPFHRW